MNTLWVALGGAAGSVARYHAQAFATRRWAGGFPWGTLFVNLLGSLLLMLLMTIALRTGRVPEQVRLALGTGVLGGFTTYSSFNYETMALAQNGQWGRAAVYLVATVAGCLATGAVGWLLAQGVR
jgi:CrcB protein